MKKRILSLLAAAVIVLLLPLATAGADGEAYWDDLYQANMYTEPHYGIVLCTKMNVRNQPSTSGTTYGSIRNGQPVKILGITRNRDFYVLDLESCGISSDVPGGYGYAKSSLIKQDPMYIATTRLTNLYATPWNTEHKNGEQTNRFFLVIDMYYDWYAVQATEGSPGTAFIRTADVGQYSQGYQNMYVVTWDTPVFDQYSFEQIQTAKRFSTARLLGMDGDFSLLVFNEGASNEYRGWVSNLRIALIIN